MLNGLDLFTGIGGLTIALREWVRPIVYCENDRYAQAVLLSKMETGELPYAPIWDDIRGLGGSLLPKDDIDIIYGGFPCQDISTAGNGEGLEGERSGLFFEVTRLAREIRPRFVFLENVPAITVRGLDRVCLEFTSMGYDSRWTHLSASSVGANHQRDRWWFLAYSNGNGVRLQSNGLTECEEKTRAIDDSQGERRGLVGNADRKWNESQSRCLEQKSSERKQKSSSRPNNTSEAVANTSIERFGKERQLRCEQPEKRIGRRSKTMANPEGIGSEPRRVSIRSEEKHTKPKLRSEISDSNGIRLEEQRSEKRRPTGAATDASWWAVEPDVGRVVNGLPNRVDRIRGLGNAVVPLQAKEAFKKLMGIKAPI